jgi:hypothetical protein
MSREMGAALFCCGYMREEDRKDSISDFPEKSWLRRSTESARLGRLWETSETSYISIKNN